MDVSSLPSSGFRKYLAFGTGVSLSVCGEDLVALVVRCRPGGTKVLGYAQFQNFGSRPAVEWASEYHSFLKKLGLTHLAATFLLPRLELVVRVIPVPPVSDKELGSAIQFQIDDLHPFGETEVEYSWARLPGTQSVLIGIVPRPVVERYVNLFQEAGIRVAVFSFSAATLYSAVRFFGSPPRDGFLFCTGNGTLEIYGESPARPILSAPVESDPERALALAASELRLAPEITPTEPQMILARPVSAPDSFSLSRLAPAYAAALTSACPWLALPLNLLPPQHRATSTRMIFLPSLVLALALVVLTSALAAMPRWNERRQLELLEAEITRLQPVARQAESFRSAVQLAQQRLALLDSFRSCTVSDLEALAALTRILQPPAWLNGLEMDRDTLVISGEIEQAAPLLKALDETPYFQNSEFVGAVGRGKQGESFRIRASREGGRP